MSKLEMAALEDIAEDVTVSHVGPTSEFFRESGIPFLRTGNVGSGRLNLKDIRYVTKEFHLKNKKSALKAGDVLVTRVISNEVNCGVVPDELGEANCGNVILIRPGARLVSAYIVHLIRNPNVQRALIQRRVGSAQSVVNTSVLKAWKIPVISTVEQKRIAEVLDRAEELRSKRREAIAQLDILTQAIFIEMFGDPVTNPKGWDADKTLGEIADIVSGITKGRKLNGQSVREVPYLAVVNVQDRMLDLSVIKTIEAKEDEIARYRLQVNDLILTEGGDPDKLGRGTLWNGELPECIHQNHIYRVRITSNQIHPLFLNWLIGSQRGKKYFLKQAKQTTGIATINMRQLRGFSLLIPPFDLQKEFARRLEAVEKLKAVHRASLSELDTLFASLQHRAFRGEL
jgi:type I restriction enzyme S subunit